MTVAPSGYVREQNDLYQTPAWVTKALLRHIDVKDCHVWEPACGMRAMSNVLAEYGANLCATDAYSYGKNSRDFEFDFIAPNPPSADCEMIITNPPYGVQNRTAISFIERALDYTQYDNGLVAMLLPAKIDFGSTRFHLFGDCPEFMMTIKLTDRIQWFEPSVDRVDAKGNTMGSTEDHMWCVWQWGNRAKPITIYERMDDQSKAELKAAKAAVKVEFLAAA